MYRNQSLESCDMWPYARHEITSLPETLGKEYGAVDVTRRGKPLLAIMPWELYESIIESLVIMSDKEPIEAFRQGINEIREGKTTPWETVKAELDL